MDEPTTVDPAAFRRAMSRWTTGVTVVTTRDGAHDLGLTVNSFLSVSLAPPSVMVSIGDESNSAPVIRRTKRFAVNVLREGQSAISTQMAQVGTGDSKFQGVGIHRGTTGLALIDGALLSLECRVVGELRASDHGLFLGEVVGVDLGEDGLPLVFYHSGYSESVGADSVRLPSPRR